MNFTDKITIAIPVFERTDYFEEALLSAVNQTVKCQVIVIDNFSSHNYFDNYLKNYNLNNQNEVLYFKNPTNLGMVENWNECIRRTQTQFLTILHDDDALHPSFIEAAISEIRKGKKYFASGVLVQNDFPVEFKTSVKKSIVYHRFRESKFLFGSLSPFPGVVFSVELAKKIGFFDTNEFPVADYDFWIRMIKECTCFKTNTKLAFYRISHNQETNNCYQQILIKAWTLQKEFFFHKYLSILSDYLLFRMYINYSPTLNDWDDLKKNNSKLYIAMQRQAGYEKKVIIKSAIKVAVKCVNLILRINLKK